MSILLGNPSIIIIVVCVSIWPLPEAKQLKEAYFLFKMAGRAGQF